jgi:hypothetical protein
MPLSGNAAASQQAAEADMAKTAAKLISISEPPSYLHRHAYSKSEARSTFQMLTNLTRPLMI